MSEIQGIISELIKAHALLAKSSLPASEYNEISHILAQVKLDLFEYDKRTKSGTLGGNKSNPEQSTQD